MQVEKVNLYHVRMPLVSPFATSFGQESERECILVEIAAGGVLGYGECAATAAPLYSPETVGTAWHILRDYLVPLVLGNPVADAGQFAKLVAPIRGHQMAKAGLEMALWDVWGQQQGKSLTAMLGGVRERVPVGVSIGIQSDVVTLLEVVEAYLDDGYQRVKLKIKPGRDVTEVRSVRELYPLLNLQVDANSAYTPRSVQALRPLDDFGLLLIEQPLAEDDLWDHHKLQQAFKTPICLDESITSPSMARRALEMDAARVINIKAGRVGGLGPAKQIHDLCASANVPVWCGGLLETGVGRAANLALASLPNFTLPGDISATERYYADDITNEVFTLNEDSTIDVPTERPGLGVSINRRVLRHHTLGTLTLD